MVDIKLDKTDKGREEIATRQHHLAPRLRTLLLLIDGKHPVEYLLSKVAGLGLTEESLTELIDAGFIYEVPEPEPEPAEAPPEAPDTSGGKTQLEQIQEFYTESIKNTIGLRGYNLQFKVDRATTVEEYRELRQPFLEMVLKEQGSETTKSIRDRLDELLFMGQPKVNPNKAPT
jgi:hypothetical protein